MDAMTIDDSSVIELRQYTMKPGRRDALIGLFEEKFIEPQEAGGIRVLGQFRDRDRPNYFVWLRGFADMPARAAALDAFYSGPVWQANRAAANDTLVDSDDVLLLRPIAARRGLPQLAARPAHDVAKRASSIVVATIYLLTSPVNDEFRAFFDSRIAPLAAATGASPVARFETEESTNNYPRLPVRSEHAYVWFATFPDEAALRAHREQLARIPAWREAEPALRKFLAGPLQQLVLEPTARSKFRHIAPFGYSLERTGARDDFDFIIGDWAVENLRLRERGTASSVWERFPATLHAEHRLGGIVNVDEMQFPAPRPAGMTVRSFDVARRQWSIRWISGRDGLMTPPVTGGFEGDRGTFFGEDRDGERPVKVRFTWTRGAERARWEQAFSYDDETWETNWIMDFTRAAIHDEAGTTRSR
jgi:quinol monooxygenase YgiN